jgi:hypothetical protein
VADNVWQAVPRLCEVCTPGTASRWSMRNSYSMTVDSGSSNGCQHMRSRRFPGSALLLGPGRWCSPRHGMPFTSTNQGSKCVSFADFQGISNGGRHFLRNRRSNRHIVPLYGKSAVYLLKVSNLRRVDRHLRYPGRMSVHDMAGDICQARPSIDRCSARRRTQRRAAERITERRHRAPRAGVHRYHAVAAQVEFEREI